MNPTELSLAPSPDMPHPRTPVNSPVATPTLWTRRAWVTSNVSTTAALLVAPQLRRRAGRPIRPTTARFAEQGALHDPQRWQALVQRAVEAAQRAGAQYADARMTRTVQHRYWFEILSAPEDMEMVGLGIRTLVNGYWGFAACPSGEVEGAAEGAADAVVHLAEAAVAQARANATGGTPRTVEMGQYPKVVGTWATPVGIDPFAASIEEKKHFIAYWVEYAQQHGITLDVLFSSLRFTRQEQVVATSDGSLFSQTRYESGGRIGVYGLVHGQRVDGSIQGISTTGRGWELFTTEARIPEQLAGMFERLKAYAALLATAKPSAVGRYTLVCDGATMASLVGHTLGVATQLDRALGYEANAGGSSFIDDPLTMVGQFPVASYAVTVTGNRSAPAQLATVKWDDEGVEPQPFTLIRDGVLTDFQTTREQATWLAPYYQQHGRPVCSHGCATAQDALCIPLQQRPNLTLEPAASAVRIEDLVADVKDGILVTGGEALDVDFQARNGLLGGDLRKITNGRLGPPLQGGAVLFNTLDLFKRIEAVGGASTTAVVSHSPYDPAPADLQDLLAGHLKGQPPQDTSYSVSAVAATITNQAVIDPRRKA